jgi:hypothetical protein
VTTRLYGSTASGISRTLRQVFSVLVGVLSALVSRTNGVELAWATAPPATCLHTSGSADQHTCGHGTTGPFEARVALPFPYLGSPLDIKNVDPTHTLYAFYLDLPGIEVFGEQPYPFELRDAFGDAVPIRLEHVITECPGYLAWVKVYELEAERYYLTVGGHPGDNVQVAIEHLEGFVTHLFADADGDGYGRPGADVASWCGVAGGFSPLGGDCDDGDPLVFPDAAGVCAGAEGPCKEGDAPEACQSGMAGDSNRATSSGGASENLDGIAGAANGGADGVFGGAMGLGGKLDRLTGRTGGTRASAGFAGSKGDTESLDAEKANERAGCFCGLGTTRSADGASWVAACVGYLLRRRRKSRLRPQV